MPTPKTGEKHTPGPGLLPGEIDYEVHGDKITLTLRLDSPHFALLTAAPDLLKALIETMKALGSAQMDGNKMTVALNNQISAAMERNRAAIRKATQGGI